VCVCIARGDAPLSGALVRKWNNPFLKSNRGSVWDNINMFVQNHACCSTKSRYFTNLGHCEDISNSWMIFNVCLIEISGIYNIKTCQYRYHCNILSKHAFKTVHKMHKMSCSVCLFDETFSARRIILNHDRVKSHHFHPCTPLSNTQCFIHSGLRSGFMSFLAHLSWKLKWAILIAGGPSSVRPSDRLSVRLTVCL
jgi:hypothetical protein